MTDKNRRRTRIHGHFGGSMEVRGITYPIATLNLSLKGLLCIISSDLDPAFERGDECNVDLILSKSVSLAIEGNIARIHGHEIGIDITSLDEESYKHLRNIVRFSADDPDAIDLEQVEKPFA